jgi:ribosome-associated protein
MAASDEDRVSKSQRKRDSQALQDLAARLVETDPALLSRLPIEPGLGEAIELARRLDKQRGARKRQVQYVGKLLRRADTAPLQQALLDLELKGRREARTLQRLENWRQRLIEEGDSAIDALRAAYPRLEREPLKSLVNDARRERADGTSTSPAYRSLFRFLRERIGTGDADSG